MAADSDRAVLAGDDAGRVGRNAGWYKLRNMKSVS
jgi:hypothetical protein